MLILEDHLLFAESLDVALTMAGYDVRRAAVPTSSAVQGLVSSVARLQPDLVLLDLDLGRFGDGRRLVSPLVEVGTSVVVVTGSTDRGRWGDCLRSGASTVLSKGRPLDEILATVQRVEQGLPVLTDQERQELMEASHARTERTAVTERLELLTGREQIVLAQLMQGRSVREIAAASYVSEATVRTQVKSVLGKLRVSSQLAAVGLAYRVEWRSPCA